MVVENNTVCGAITKTGITFRAKSSTYCWYVLGGKIHIGKVSNAGGRAGDQPSNALAARLRSLPLE